MESGSPANMRSKASPARLTLQDRCLARVKYAKFRVDSGGDGIFAQQARAEAMDGRNIGLLELSSALRHFAEQLGKPLLHVARGFLGERDGQNALRRYAGLHQAAVTLHQHARLSRTRAGHHAGVLPGFRNVDRVELPRSEFHSGALRDRRLPRLRTGKRL